MVGVLNFQSCGLYGVKVANDDNLKEGFFFKTLFSRIFDYTKQQVRIGYDIFYTYILESYSKYDLEFYFFQ